MGLLRLLVSLTQFLGHELFDLSLRWTGSSGSTSRPEALCPRQCQAIRQYWTRSHGGTARISSVPLVVLPRAIRWIEFSKAVDAQHRVVRASHPGRSRRQPSLRTRGLYVSLRRAVLCNSQARCKCDRKQVQHRLSHQPPLPGSRTIDEQSVGRRAGMDRELQTDSFIHIGKTELRGHQFKGWRIRSMAKP